MRFIGFYDYTVILTHLSLISAVSGMFFASGGNFTSAVFCLFFSGFCDAFDGIVARSKKNRTEDEKSFGIQLDSLCDVVSFGVFPAFLCYQMGVIGPVGLVCVFGYSLCALIRLAFFNVLEEKRQKTETGCNKTYRGLPVTSISIIFPLVYLLRSAMPESAFSVVLHIMLALTGFLFILDFSVKKPDWLGLLKKIAGKK
ncbi:MAG: CDP-alcohol phosphatidyltransferase family protein [Oscillospiraceae bacterium]|nr:CDP-alcohol phosphatidyltransferase family protein [Oscillospiraceae bacterium]